MNQELEKIFQSPVGEAGAPQFNFQSFLSTSSPTVSPREVTDEEPATSLNSNNNILLMFSAGNWHLSSARLGFNQNIISLEGREGIDCLPLAGG